MVHSATLGPSPDRGVPGEGPMFQTTSAVCRLALITAAAALSAACGGVDISHTERASAALPDVRVRTPLVDDDGWPMPADPPPAGAARSAGVDKQATR